MHTFLLCQSLLELLEEEALLGRELAPNLVDLGVELLCSALVVAKLGDRALVVHDLLLKVHDLTLEAFRFCHVFLDVSLESDLECTPGVLSLLVIIDGAGVLLGEGRVGLFKADQSLFGAFKL